MALSNRINWGFWFTGTLSSLSFLLAAEFGYIFALTPVAISPIWPPTGVALASVLIFGLRLIPFIAVGSILSNIYGGVPFFPAIGVVVGNVLEALLGYYLVRRYCESKNPLDRSIDLVKFLLLAALISTMASATLGVSSLTLFGNVPVERFFDLWRVWWLGDVFGNLVVAPFLLAWFYCEDLWTPKKIVEAIVLSVFIVAASELMFGGWVGARIRHFPIEHLITPLLVIASFRFGQRGATTGILLFTIIAAWGTAGGYGPFARGTPTESLHTLQLFVGSSAIMVFFISSVRKQYMKTQDALRDSESLYQSLVESLPLKVFRKDMEGKFIFANQSFCKGLGKSQKEILGKSDFDLFPKELATKYRKDDVELLVSGRSMEQVEEQVSTTGIQSYVHVLKVPVRDVYGKVLGVQGAFWDVTEQKKVENELILAKKSADSANSAKTEFLANMSHEMRTPLAALSGFAELLDDPSLSNEEQSVCRARIRRSVANLKDLIDDILDLSKVEAGKLNIENIRFSLRDELLNIYELLKVEAKNKHLALKFKFDGKLPESIDSDPTRFRQILLNIIGNAIKFTERGGVWVHVNLDRKSRSLVILVKDTGCGISDEQQQKIFQSFVQADSSTTRKYGGTGLGLVLSRRLAQALGGNVILLESKSGVGSVFEVRISAGELGRLSAFEDFSIPEILSPARVDKLKFKSRKLLDKFNVLVAEDGEDNRTIIAHFLTSAGAKVSLAEDGKQAFEMAKETPFDVILMDIQMPHWDGYRATKELRGIGYTSPIIALTAHAMLEDKQKCLDVGCNAYLSKPVFRNRLIETVKEVGMQGRVRASLS